MLQLQIFPNLVTNNYKSHVITMQWLHFSSFLIRELACSKQNNSTTNCITHSKTTPLLVTLHLHNPTKDCNDQQQCYFKPLLCEITHKQNISMNNNCVATNGFHDKPHTNKLAIITQFKCTPNEVTLILPLSP